MKVIDLLNKIENGEEVPKEIKYKGIVFKYIWTNRKPLKYINEEYKNGDNARRHLFWYVDKLYDEIEVIEEEQNIKELWIDDSGYIHTELGSWKGRKMDIAFATKINEVIKEVNKQKNNEEVL